MADTKTKFKFKQIDKSLTADVDLVKGSDTMLKLDHANNKTILGSGAISVEIDGALQIDGALSGASFKDEDNMTSNSATAVASQQSIKAYVDAQMTGSDLDFQGDSGGALSIDLDSEVLDIAGGTNITTVGSGNEITVSLDATVHNAALKIGRDADNIVDFATTDNEIIFRANGGDQVRLIDGVFKPETDSDIDLGDTGNHFKDLYIDGIEIGAHGDNDTKITRSGAGDIQIGVNRVFRAGGADVPVADGGTGLSAVAKGSVLVANSADTLSALDGGGSASGVLAYAHGSDTISWKPQGIADGNVVLMDTSGHAAADNDYAKFTANGVEGMSFSQVMGDLSGAATASFSLGNQKITSLATPTLDSDAATKAYVDSVAEGLDVKNSVLCATTANLADLSYNGAAGTGNVGTLTAQGGLANSTVSLDGIPLMEIGQRVLIKDQADPKTSNGIYSVTTVGKDGTNAKLQFKVMGAHQNIADNNLMKWEVDHDGTGGAQKYQLVAKTSGNTSTSFTGAGTNADPFTANVRINDVSGNASLILQRIRRIISDESAAGKFKARDKWFVSSEGVDGSGNPIFDLVAVDANAAAYNFSIGSGADIQWQNGSSGMESEIAATAAGAGGAASLVLTRAADADNLAGSAEGEFGPGCFVFVEQGSVQADSGFVCTTDSEIPFQNNTVDIAFAQFSGAGAFTASLGVKKIGSDFQADLNTLAGAVVDVANDSIAIIDANDGNLSKKESIADLVAAMDGDGLAATNGVLAIDLATNPALQITSNKLDMKIKADSGLAKDVNGVAAVLDGSGGLEFNGATGIRLKSGVAGDGLAHSGGVLSVGVDDSSIEVDSDVLRVKALGVTNAMLAGSIADSKLSTIAAGNKVSGSAVQLAGTSAIEDSSGLRLKSAVAGAGLTLTSQVLSLSNDEIVQGKLNSIEAYHIATGALGSDDLLHGNLVYGEDSAVQNLNNLLSAVDDAGVQKLNRTMSVKVYLNGQLLMPDATGNHSTTFTLGSADYKFHKDGSDIKIRFNGALVESGDLIVISGMALS